MEKKIQTNNEIAEIKEINEDSYWAKEYGISPDEQKKAGHTTAIFDKIIESYLKTQKSTREGSLA